ncbi:DUF2254 domain-containing protein [soil metagenome]
MIRFRQYISALRASFWFVPMLIIALSVVLAISLIEYDVGGIRPWMRDWPRVFGAGADGARGMLVTVAGSMMTVVGVTFSMTLVTLALASSQYTSRILRNFMRNRMTQISIGLFAGIFIYCLIVLRSIRGGDEGEFIPSMSVTVGVMLAMVGITVLIFFIHHIAFSIQASAIISSVADESMDLLDRLYPDEIGDAPPELDHDEDASAAAARVWQPIPSRTTGYIQDVEAGALMRIAKLHHGIIRMERGVGEFVVKGAPVASIATIQVFEKSIGSEVRGAYGINRFRTLDQDPSFGIRMLVDIALRALSPSTNDTTTGVMCIDYLTAILTRLAGRVIPPTYRYDEGALRVIGMGPSFESMVAESFDEIRGSSGGNVSIMLRLLAALEIIGSQTTVPSRRSVLREQMRAVVETAQRTIDSPRDKLRIAARFDEVQKAMGE